MNRRMFRNKGEIPEKRVFLKLFSGNFHKCDGKDQIFSCEFVVCIKCYRFFVYLGDGYRNLVAVAELD